MTSVDDVTTHLSRALEAADALSDRAQPDDRRARYLEPELLDAIDRAATFDGRITLIVGAGASMEAGLPSWPILVRGMLDEVASNVVAEDIRKRWIKAVEDEGLLAATAVVKALTESDDAFGDLLRRALYRTRPMTSYVPQALAQQIAWLKRELGDSVTIATGNYDGLLEQALRDLDLTVHSYITGRTEAPGSAAVYHLHGRLMPGYPATGRLILSEDDYARVQHPGAWQERFVRAALKDTLCIFVGLSMTDPNLIRWLYRYSERAPDSRRHIALFVRQGAQPMSNALRDSLEATTRARWERGGVDTVWADFFGESAQVLHEIALQRSGRAIGVFHDRAAERLNAARFFLAPDDEAAFRTRQDTWSRLLSDQLDRVRDVSTAAGLDLSGEQLGLGLWVVNHADGTVACWVTADRRLNSRSALIDNPLEYHSRWIAVQAVTRGVVVQDDPNVFASRWRLVRGIPIEVSEPDGAGRTIVGAMTLTSMTPHGASALSRAPRGLLGAVDRILADPASLLFQP